ncbi:MAG: hypothetical protein AAGJ85_07975 [Pseudomonadota bacterium]
MRRTSLVTGLGAALLAAPAFAHHGGHGGNDTSHWLVEHGMAAGLVGLALATALAAFFMMKRKG